jgi:hypothetical protein
MIFMVDVMFGSFDLRRPSRCFMLSIENGARQAHAFPAPAKYAERRIRMAKMERLSADDFRKVLGAIEILGRDIDETTFPERAVDAITAVIDVDMISYSEVDLATGANRFLLKPDIADIDPDDARYLRFVRRFGNHPILAHQLSRAPAMRPDLGQFLERIRMMGMIGNCCGDAELTLSLGLTVEDADTRKIGIAVNRGVRDFDHHDAARLETLRPHIVAAYRNALRVAARTSVTTATSSAIRIDGCR